MNVVSNRPDAMVRRLIALAAALTAGAALSAEPVAQIYSCVDASGKRHTSDRPIVECNAREQRELNTDGSVKRVVRPTMTADEAADYEERERAAVVERAAKQDAIRRDRNLLLRFPNEAAHRKARELALDDMRTALRRSETRIELLKKERKPLLDEAEFYVGRTMPGFLRAQLDANETSLDATRALQQNQQQEIVRINQLYDAELERLKKLWAGAQPGSMGALSSGPASAPRK